MKNSRHIGAPTLRIDVNWDGVRKVWRLTAVRWDENGNRITVRAATDSRVAIDRETAQALLRLVQTDLETRIF